MRVLPGRKLSSLAVRLSPPQRRSESDSRRSLRTVMRGKRDKGGIEGAEEEGGHTESVR